MNNCIVYIGDFDLRNENVQAHLVRNNGEIFASLEYKIVYIGVNRELKTFGELKSLPPLYFFGDLYYEVPNTFNHLGVIKCLSVCDFIINMLDEISENYNIKYVMTYQSPTYAIALTKIIKWSRKNGSKYIVNSADLPIFELQSRLQRYVMKLNWDYLHRVNYDAADGIVAVSQYIQKFYYKVNRASIVVPPLFMRNDPTLKIKKQDIPCFVYAGTPFVITGHEANPGGMKDRLDYIVDLMIELQKSNILFNFKIIGITKEDYVQSVPRHYDFCNSNRCIQFLGKLSHENTIDEIKKADFSINYRDINLMTQAGFSTKIVESVSLGTPVVINSISDTFLYLENGIDAFELSGNLNTDTQVLSDLCKMSAEDRMTLKTKLFKKNIFAPKNYIQNFKTFFETLDG